MTETSKFFVKVNLPFFIIAFVGIFYITDFYFFLLSLIIFYFLIYIVAFNIYIHRIVCHNQYKVGKLTSLILGYLGSFCMLGDPLSVALSHRFHHRYSDSSKDLHSPVHGFWHSFLFWIFQKNPLMNYLSLIKDLSYDKEPQLHFLLKYSVLLIWITFLILLLFNINVAFGLAVAMNVSFYLEMLGNAAFYHSSKEKKSVNNFYSWISFSPYHHDHHTDPSGKTIKDPLQVIFNFLIQKNILR